MRKSRKTKLAVPTVESLSDLRAAERRVHEGTQQISPFTFDPLKGTQFYGRRRGFADSRLNSERFKKQLDEARLISFTANALLANPDYAAAVWTNEGRWAVNTAGTVVSAEHRKAVPELLPGDTNRAPALRYAAHLAIAAGTEASPFVQPLETQLDVVRAATMGRLTCRSLGRVAANTIEPTPESELQIPPFEERVVGQLPLLLFDSMRGKLFGSEPTLPPSLNTAPFTSEALPPRFGELFTGVLKPEQP